MKHENITKWGIQNILIASNITGKTEAAYLNLVFEMQWNLTFLQHHLSDKRHFSVFCPKAVAGSNNQMVSWFSQTEYLTLFLSATALASFQPLLVPLPVASGDSFWVRDGDQQFSVGALRYALWQTFTAPCCDTLPNAYQERAPTLPVCWLFPSAAWALTRGRGTRPDSLGSPSSSFAASPFAAVGNAGILRKSLEAPVARYMLGPFTHFN